MKKILSILTLFVLVGITNAQTVSTMVNSASTFTNTTPVTATLQTQSVCENVTLQAVVTKSTGTVAGTVQVSASLDGTNFVSITSASLALTDVATQSKVFEFTNNNYMYWKVTFTGSGTMVATPAAYLYTSGSSNKHAVNNMVTPTNSAVATTTNTSTSYVSLPVTAWYNTVTIQSVVTKVSGTVGGTVTLQGSLDGTNYSTVSSSYADVTSYTPTDQATNSKLFVVTGSPYKYYRLSYTGTGTMNATHRGYLMPNKK